MVVRRKTDIPFHSEKESKQLNAFCYFVIYLNHLGYKKKKNFNLHILKF